MAKAAKKTKLKAVPSQAERNAKAEAVMAAMTKAKSVAKEHPAWRLPVGEPVSAPHEDDKYDEQAAAQAEARRAQMIEQEKKAEPQHTPGTPLRDAFAIAALTALSGSVNNKDTLAAVAWDIAESMMAERARRYG